MAWTREQELAINTRDRTLLVSAAAGSGKTATLTERIIQSILDEGNPADIGRMLIVTYTNAAVDELRERIGKAIKKAARENPDNSALEEQLLRLQDAKILTITSFCNSILRMSAESVGLAPNYRIAEPAEAKIISSAVLEGLISAAYEGELSEVCSAEEFMALADTLAPARYQEALADSFSYVFGKLSSTAAGIDTLLPLIEEYNPEKYESVDKTRLGAHMISLVKEAFAEYERAYSSAARSATNDSIDTRNLIRLEGDLATIKAALTAADYTSLKSVIDAYAGKSLSRSAKEEITDFYSRFKTIRSLFSSDMKAWKSSYFVYSEEEWRNLYSKLYNLLSTFYRFLKKFYDVFMDEKRRRGICEFSDVERYAYEALYDKNGGKTELAHEISLRFDSIYIDEYQDVNELQNNIFAAIAKENNRFMVGDIKQSIYVFRSARPEIFAGMKESFPPLGDDGDYPSASIFMSNNFRCDRTVIDFVNGIFDRMFGLLGKSIGYIPDDKLKFSKIYNEGSTPCGIIPEIHIIEKPHAEEDGEDDEAAAAEEENRSAASLQAMHIKNKIRELLDGGRLADGRRIEPRDISILVRAVKSELTEALTRELKDIGVGVSVSESKNLFMCSEVLLALSFLYSIDNPKRDVYLAALMCSPIYSFTADELAIIRSEFREGALWDSLIEYAGAHPEHEKVSSFILSLRRYRRLCEGMATDELLSFIYRESGLLALCSKSGGRENLLLLHSYAAKYEKSDFKGLYSFISFINAVIERGETYPAAGDAEEENSIKIMTVHKSKGLEFPVTILADASSYSHGGKGGRVTFSEGLGIAMKAKDVSGLALVDNPAVHIISDYIKRSEFDEEMRVLYVALTRAREQLYIYGVCNGGSPEEYLEYIDSLRSCLCPYFLSKSKSFLDMIMLSRESGRVIIDPALPLSEKAEKAIEAQQKSAPVHDISDDAELLNELTHRFEFKSQYHHLEKLPRKLSISVLSPTVLDESDGCEMLLENLLKKDGGVAEEAEPNENSGKRILPSFMNGESTRESAERGIATHTVLQFCDFSLLEKNGTAAELQRLLALEFISERDLARVRTDEIDRFVRSALFSELKGAKKLHRELRFNLHLPADRFTADAELREKLSEASVLVQGVIDCIIEDKDGNLHLVDYKTDRLTREELNDPGLAAKRLKSAHQLQLSYYTEAIRLMFGKEPVRVGIYSLHLGKEIPI